MRTAWTGAGLAAVLLSVAVTAQAADTKEVHRTLSLDRDGRVSIHTYKGTVTVAGLDGAARVDTYKGEVRVEFARFSRASRFDTHKGEIDVRLPKDSHFELDADTGRRGDIESDFAMTTRAGRSRAARATGAVNGGGPELRLTTYKGTLRIRAS